MPLDSQEKDGGKKNEQRHVKLVRNEKRQYDAGYPPPPGKNPPPPPEDHGPKDKTDE